MHLKSHAAAWRLSLTRLGMVKRLIRATLVFDITSNTWTPPFVSNIRRYTTSSKAISDVSEKPKGYLWLLGKVTPDNEVVSKEGDFSSPLQPLSIYGCRNRVIPAGVQFSLQPLSIYGCRNRVIPAELELLKVLKQNFEFDSHRSKPSYDVKCSRHIRNKSVLYYYRLEIDVILVVTRTIYNSVNLLLGSLLKQNLQAPMILRHFNDNVWTLWYCVWLDEALFGDN